MSLPFIPPPQLLAVDDVLGVEVLADADAGWQDAREHLGVEHYAGSSSQDAAHRVVVVPVAVAILAVDTDAGLTDEDRFRIVWSKGFSYGPVWHGNFLNGAVFDFTVPRPWFGIGVGARSSDGAYALGWVRVQEPMRPERGRVVHSTGNITDLDGILITVLGER